MVILKVSIVYIHTLNTTVTMYHRDISVHQRWYSSVYKSPKWCKHNQSSNLDGHVFCFSQIFYVHTGLLSGHKKNLHIWWKISQLWLELWQRFSNVLCVFVGINSLRFSAAKYRNKSGYAISWWNFVDTYDLRAISVNHKLKIFFACRPGNAVQDTHTHTHAHTVLDFSFCCISWF